MTAVLVLAAVRNHADLRGKRGTFIYDVTACRELVLITEPDGSDSSAYDPDAKEPVVPDQSTVDALSSKLGRILGVYCMFSYFTLRAGNVGWHSSNDFALCTVEVAICVLL